MRLAPAQGVVLQGTDGRQLIVNPNSGARYLLDGLGRRVWEMLGSRPTFPTLISRLCGTYQSRGDLARDTGRLVVAWQQAGLITWTP
jgi:Coenzyme PQQ synthesis protein D (PqqD)